MEIDYLLQGQASAPLAPFPPMSCLNAWEKGQLLDFPIAIETHKMRRPLLDSCIILTSSSPDLVAAIRFETPAELRLWLRSVRQQ